LKVGQTSRGANSNRIPDGAIRAQENQMEMKCVRFRSLHYRLWRLLLQSVHPLVVNEMML